MEKEKNPSKKEKEKIIYNPSYKFPRVKIPKMVYKQIQNVEPLTKEERIQYLTAIALGAIPDRFGMETSMQDRLKALEQINKLTEDQLDGGGEEEAGVIIDDIG